MVFARIRGTKNELRLLADSTLRLQRKGVRKIGDDLYEVPAVLEEYEVGILQSHYYDVVIQGDVKRVLSERLAATRPAAASYNSPEQLFYSVETNAGYMDTDYIESWTTNLARLYPALCTSLALRNKTWEGRASAAIRLRAADSAKRPAVLFTSGVHAAELGGPDSCIYFLFRLLKAYQAKAAIVLGAKTFSADQVRDILDNIDIFVFPCVNPDGRVFVQTKNEWWRKNRNPNVGMRATGVDINRNFDFLWSSGIGSSSTPVSDIYKGSAAFSEPETRNVQWMLDISSPDFFMDIHGFSGTLVYVWGDALDQSQDPSMSFRNPTWDGKRNLAYKEYLNAADSLLVTHVGDRIVSAANAVNGAQYDSLQSYSALYPTTATSDDYAFSRHLAASDQHKTFAYTLEYRSDEFVSTYAGMQSVIDEVNAAMLELCSATVAARQ